MEMLLCVFGVRTQIGQIRAAEQGERNGKNELAESCRTPSYPGENQRETTNGEPQIDALPSPEENDHRTWPAMPEGAACQSEKKKGLRQNAPQKGDDTLRPLLCDQKLPATEQSRRRPAQNSPAEESPRETTPKGKPYRRKVARVRAAG